MSIPCCGTYLLGIYKSPPPIIAVPQSAAFDIGLYDVGLAMAKVVFPLESWILAALFTILKLAPAPANVIAAPTAVNDVLLCTARTADV